MIHGQSPFIGWIEALLAYGEGASLKAFEGGMLVDGVRAWLTAGRRRETLFTDFRFYNFRYPFDRPYSFAEHCVIWRMNFARCFDRTMLGNESQGVPSQVQHINGVEALNEHMDTRHANDPELLAPHLLTLQAASWVWETEYRGKVVRSADGGEGRIPDDCRLIIANMPVGNDSPREVVELAIQYDNIFAYHNYTRIWKGVREPEDFRYLSGRIFYNLLEQGLWPKLAFTECGAFASADEGWRDPDVLNGDRASHARAVVAVLQDVMETEFYKRGLIVGGPGMLFTSSNNPNDWALYKMDRDDHIAMARAVRPVWKYVPRQESSMDPTTRQYINTRLNTIDQATGEIRAKVNETPVLYEAIALGDLVLRDTAGNPAHTADRTLAQAGTPGDVVKKGTRVKVYKDGQTAGVYRSRAWVTPDGLNVATASGGQPLLQKL